MSVTLQMALSLQLSFSRREVTAETYWNAYELLFREKPGDKQCYLYPY